jgi:hypothetical protein
MSERQKELLGIFLGTVVIIASTLGTLLFGMLTQGWRFP